MISHAENIPLEEHIKIISSWDKKEGYSTLILYVKKCLGDDLSIKIDRGLYQLSFANKNSSRKVLQALRKNNIFWEECWFSSNRNYVFSFEVL